MNRQTSTNPIRLHWPVVLAVLALTVMACNLFAPAEVAEVDVPRVDVRVPVNNTSFAQGATVRIQALAVDDSGDGGGISRVTMEVDGLPAEEITLPEPLPFLAANFEWVADGSGLHPISIRAFRADGTASFESVIQVNISADVMALNAGAAASGSDDLGIIGSESDPGDDTSDMPAAENAAGDADDNADDNAASDISGDIPETEDDPAAGEAAPAATEEPASAPPADNAADTSGQDTAGQDTSGEEPSGPVISGTTNSGVNVRSGPGTNFDVVSALVSGTVIDIRGRNTDSSWLLVDLNEPEASQGWVWSPLVDATQDFGTLPVVDAPAE